MTEQDRVIRVLIADDHPVVREGLRALLARQDDMMVVAEAGTGREAVELFVRHKPDIGLVDLRMPDISGIQVIESICKALPNARTIVLTTYDGDDDIYRALRAGAKAYMLKDSPRDELMSCIRAVHDGKNWISKEAASKLAARMSTTALTDRELEVLKIMAAGKSNKEIASALRITEGTVKAHMSRILEKLGVAGRTEAISTAVKRGIVHLG